MKNTKKMVALLITILLTTSLAVSQADASGNGNRKGNHGGGDQVQSQFSKPTSTHFASGTSVESLTQDEEDRLIYQYSEEMLARDVYLHFFDLYDETTFEKIANSEQKHMDSVGSLLEAFGIDIPTGYGELEDEVEEFKTSGEDGLKQALEVGVGIEMLDIEDNIKTLKMTDVEEIKTVLMNIGGASYNHLRGFLNTLEANGFETDLDYSDYLDEDDLGKGGNLKSLILERLEEEGVEVPETLGGVGKQHKHKNSEGENCENPEKQGTGNMNKGNMNKSNKSQSKGTQAKGNTKKVNSNYGNSYQNKYYNSVKTKYAPKIEVLSESKLTTLLEKVEDLKEQIEDNDGISSLTKEKYLEIVEALLQVIMDKLTELELDIDSLFD